MVNRKNVLITGVSRGLGKELFDLFIAKGYHVYGVVRNSLVANKLQSKSPDNRVIIQTDLSSDKAIKDIQKLVGQNKIDLLINNAGIGGKIDVLENIEPTDILELFNIHCLGVFRTTKALKSNLLKAKDPVVLNLNSRFGSITRQSNGTYKDLDISYSYRIGKAAQNMLTNCFRLEFGGKVKFISIHPGKMKTEIAQVDADMEPAAVAQKFLEYYESGNLKEENGIIELDKEIIEW